MRRPRRTNSLGHVRNDIVAAAYWGRLADNRCPLVRKAGMTTESLRQKMSHNAVYRGVQSVVRVAKTEPATVPLHEGSQDQRLVTYPGES